jgi:hypothetical protein
MGQLVNQAISRRLLREEIRRIVADARANGTSILHTSDHAARLAAIYPTAGYSVGHIIDEIVMAAATAGLAVEIARPNNASFERAVWPSVKSGGQSAIVYSLARRQQSATKPKEGS